MGRLIDIDDLSRSAKNVGVYIPPCVIDPVPTADVIPCGFIRAKAYKAVGPERTYLEKLLDDWEQEVDA